MRDYRRKFGNNGYSRGLSSGLYVIIIIVGVVFFWPRINNAIGIIRGDKGGSQKPNEKDVEKSIHEHGGNFALERYQDAADSLHTSLQGVGYDHSINVAVIRSLIKVPYDRMLDNDWQVLKDAYGYRHDGNPFTDNKFNLIEMLSSNYFSGTWTGASNLEELRLVLPENTGI